MENIRFFSENVNINPWKNVVSEIFLRGTMNKLYFIIMYNKLFLMNFENKMFVIWQILIFVKIKHMLYSHRQIVGIVWIFKRKVNWKDTQLCPTFPQTFHFSTLLSPGTHKYINQGCSIFHDMGRKHRKGTFN